MEVTGIIKWVSAPREFTKQDGSKDSVVSFVIEDTTDRYPKSYVLDVYGDFFTRNANYITVGNSILARFDGKAREYNGNYYNSLKCWWVGNPQVQQGYAPQQPVYQATAQPAPSPFAQPQPTQQYPPQAQPMPQFPPQPQQGFAPQQMPPQAPPQMPFPPQQDPNIPY